MARRVSRPGSEAPKPLVMAAGGLVWRVTARGRELAVVHRPKYDDWTLPKGKVEPGEGYEEAARREAEEETGHEVTPADFAGVVRYSVEGAPKVVLFWNMMVASDRTSRPASDVDGLVWLSPGEAVQRLSHDRERELVMMSAAEDRAPKSLGQHARAIIGRSADDRLASSLAAYRVELDRLIRQCATENKDRSHWAEAARRLLDRAQEAVDRGEDETGWQCFHAAQRMEIFGLALCRGGALEARAQAILAEARSKLSPWRKAVVEKLLVNNGELKPRLATEEVVAASHILHEHYRNVYQRLRINHRQLGVLALVGAAALIIWLTLGPPVLRRESFLPAQMEGMAPAVVLLGILGACVSGILSLARESTAKRIPDQLLSLIVTVCRPIVGAIAALAIYVFAMTPLVSSVIAAEIVTPSVVLFVAFASGVTERLIDRAIGALTREPSESGK